MPSTAYLRLCRGRDYAAWVGSGWGLTWPARVSARLRSAYSQGVEEGQQAVRGLVSAGSGVGGRGVGPCPPLFCHFGRGGEPTPKQTAPRPTTPPPQNRKKKPPTPP